jgi:voltage-gated sodium channel
MYQRIHNLVTCSKFQNFIIALIIINGITMGLETSRSVMESYGSFIHFFDRFVIAVFTIEILLRIYVHRVQFFKDPWSLFDFFVVAISLVPLRPVLKSSGSLECSGFSDW